MRTEPFYVYMHCDADTGVPFYVGKGGKQRAFSRAARNAAWRSIVKNSRKPFKIVIASTHDTDGEAKDAEAALIQKYGQRDNGGVLVNVSLKDTKPDVVLKVKVSTTIDEGLHEWLMEWIERQPVAPTRNAVMTAAIVAFLDKQEASGSSKPSS